MPETSGHVKQSDASLVARIQTLEAALRGMHSTWNNFVGSFVTLDFAYKHPQMTQDMLTTSHHFHYLCCGGHTGGEYDKQTMDPSASKSANKTSLPIRQPGDTIKFHPVVNGVRKELYYKLDPSNRNVAYAQHVEDITKSDAQGPFVQLTLKEMTRERRKMPPQTPEV